MPNISKKAIKVLKDKEIDQETREIFSKIFRVFTYGAAFIYQPDSVSKEEINSLLQLKGFFEPTDIIIDSIINREKPQIDQVPDDDITLKAAVFMAEKIVSSSKK